MSTPPNDSPSPFDSIPNARALAERLAESAHQAFVQLTMMSARLHGPEFPLEVLAGIAEGVTRVHWEFDLAHRKSFMHGTLVHRGQKIDLTRFSHEIDHTPIAPGAPGDLPPGGPAIH